MFDLRDALRGDFRGWTGLPPALTAKDALAAIGAVAHVAPAVEQMRDDTVREVNAVTRGGGAPVLELWSRRGSGRIDSIEFDLDVSSAPAEAVLGVPELRLNDRRFHAEGSVTECVWAARGITLSVLRPFAAPPDRIVHVQLYAATTPAVYLSEIGVAAHETPR